MSVYRHHNFLLPPSRRFGALLGGDSGPALIQHVAPEGVAMSLGLEVGICIVRVNGENITEGAKQAHGLLRTSPLRCLLVTCNVDDYDPLEAECLTNRKSSLGDLSTRSPTCSSPSPYSTPRSTESDEPTWGEPTRLLVRRGGPLGVTVGKHDTPRSPGVLVQRIDEFMLEGCALVSVGGKLVSTQQAARKALEEASSSLDPTDPSSKTFEVVVRERERAAPRSARGMRSPKQPIVQSL